MLLGNDHLSAADFCELASAGGARLLYLQADSFDADTDPDLDVRTHQPSAADLTTSARLTEFRQDAERFNGRTRQIELSFAAECILHCCAVTADWYDRLGDRAAELYPYAGRTRQPES